MCNLRVILLILFAFVLSGTAEHAMRIWEDVNGNQIEGRFLREMFGKLTVETKDGAEKIFVLEELSEVDQKYLRVMVPPKIELNVKKTSTLVEKKEIPETDSDDFKHRHRATVLITKKSQRPFTSRLKIEIFMVADEIEGPNHVLLGLTDGDFILPSVTKGAEVEFKSDAVETVVFRDVISGVMKGADFKGCLVVISTMQGDIVMMDSNLPSWIEDEEVVKNLRDLFIRGAASVRSRHFDETGKKVPPPRPPYRAPVAP